MEHFEPLPKEDGECATALQDLALKVSLDKLKRESEWRIRPKGYCYNCHEKLSVRFTEGERIEMVHLFCDNDCAEDYKKLNATR